MLYFTTYFDKNYLSQGLTLHHSLKEQKIDFKLYVLCFDEETLSFLNKYKQTHPEIETLTLSDLEKNEDELLEAKNNRSLVEYYFTLSPCLPLYLLKTYHLPHICSLDADMLFLDDPTPIFDYLKEYSVVITPHKFSPQNQIHESFGIYNVSFQLFKNNATGIACLEKWKSQCIAWCKDVLEEDNDRFADQRYLNNWPILYPGQVKILNDKVSGIAPWNVSNYTITKKNKHFFSDGERIIFYHFHHFKILKKKWAINGFKTYDTTPTKSLISLYKKYWFLMEKYNKKYQLNFGISNRHSYEGKPYEIIEKEKSIFYKFLHTVRFKDFTDKKESYIKKFLFFYG